MDSRTVCLLVAFKGVMVRFIRVFRWPLALSSRHATFLDLHGLFTQVYLPFSFSNPRRFLNHPKHISTGILLSLDLLHNGCPYPLSVLSPFLSLPLPPLHLFLLYLFSINSYTILHQPPFHSLPSSPSYGIQGWIHLPPASSHGVLHLQHPLRTPARLLHHPLLPQYLGVENVAVPPYDFNSHGSAVPMKGMMHEAALRHCEDGLEGGREGWREEGRERGKEAVRV